MEPLAFFEWRCHLLLGGCLSYEVKTKKIFRHNTKLTGYCCPADLLPLVKISPKRPSPGMVGGGFMRVVCFGFRRFSYSGSRDPLSICTWRMDR